MANSSYQHPNDTNLNNLHKAMELVDNQPHVRVTLGSDNITITGSVNVATEVKINNTESESIPVHLTDDPIAVTQSTDPWKISKNASVNSSSNPLDVTFTNTSIGTTFTNTSIGVTQSTDPWKISKNASVNSSSNPLDVTFTNTSIGTTFTNTSIGVTQSTDPWKISKNASVNSASNPIYVSNEGSNVTVGNFPDASVTAFEEPLAVGITPLLQAEAIYGLDPDYWSQTVLNNGSITNDTHSTWRVQSGTSAGGYARLATNKYVTYQPGQGSMFRWTAAFTATGTTQDALGVDDIMQLAGPYDKEDGYAFGYSGSSVNNASRKLGILHRRSGNTETRKLTITTAPTGNQTATIILSGISYTISLTASTSVGYTATQIADHLKVFAEPNNMWDIEACSGAVTFSYYTHGEKNGTYSFSSTGTGTIAIGTFSRLVIGSTPTETWTYVDQWDNQSIQFDPTKLNVFGVDLRWLGAGRVRFFMEDPSTGRMALVHTQKWVSQYLVPHLDKPSLRMSYRSGTTNAAITPSQNVIVTGASVFGAIQGLINQTGSSQGYFNIEPASHAKDTVWHLMSIQNPFVRNNTVNKSALLMQEVTVSVQCTDPSVVYIVKNAVGTSDYLVFNSVPVIDPFMFAQFSISAVSETIGLDRITNVQTLGINGNSTFNLSNYNLSLAPGEYMSMFISSSAAINKSSIGITWRVI
jgi:hypothetical protein